MSNKELIQQRYSRAATRCYLEYTKTWHGVYLQEHGPEQTAFAAMLVSELQPLVEQAGLTRGDLEEMAQTPVVGA